MLFTTSVLARLPLAAFSLGVLVHVEHLTGSYTAAGAAAGALAAAQGVGGPLLGRLVDRHGQTAVLLGSALTAAAALGTIAAVPDDTPLGVLMLLAALIGLATPPVGACLRTLIPLLRSGPVQQRRAYAVDAAATELTWIAGPPLALGGGILAGSDTALAAAGLVLVLATTLFALSPASRTWRPPPVTRSRGTALASPALRVLVAVLGGVGVLFGATEVATTAAAGPAAGLLLGLWGAGSLAGGVVAARLGGGAAAGRGFTRLLAALGAGHLLLVAASATPLSFAVAMVVAGSLIAPILASSYALVGGAAPAGTSTEAFAWLATATAVGTSIGAAAGGALVDVAGPGAAFTLAGAAALLAAALSAARLPPAEGPPATADPAPPGPGGHRAVLGPEQPLQWPREPIGHPQNLGEDAGRRAALPA
ncbi:MFS transporter [Jidongwangia harbinensis]|uniref:MFS transporter n=1 Tax=Jidongwangia harbinensis TaxID=2878561 RepID=UPI001CD9B272|nr:MFS transporter [Jidongwangia harbinensis]MCA2217164.1 MFS transporter [Jidongwangia harbinensis]